MADTNDFFNAYLPKNRGESRPRLYGGSHHSV